MLFCELYLHVRLAGGEEPISVLGSAVLGLCGQLLDDVTPARVTAVCRALKLAGAPLEQQVTAELDGVMERVRAAAFDGRLPRDERHALLELTTLRAAHWGGGAQPSQPPADTSRPLQVGHWTERRDRSRWAEIPFFFKLCPHTATHLFDINFYSTLKYSSSLELIEKGLSQNSIHRFCLYNLLTNHIHNIYKRKVQGVKKNSR